MSEANGHPPAVVPDVPGLHVARLLAQARNEATRSQTVVFAPLAPPPLPPAERPALDWAELARAMDGAAEFADPDAPAPEAGRFGVVGRFVWRWARRGVSRLVRRFTQRQRRCNHQTLLALRRLAALLPRLEEADRELIWGLHEAARHQHGILLQHQQVLQRHQTVFQRHEAARQVQETAAERQREAVRSHQEVLQQQQMLLREYRRRLDEHEARLAEVEQRLRDREAIPPAARADATWTIPC